MGVQALPVDSEPSRFVGSAVEKGGCERRPTSTCPVIACNCVFALVCQPWGTGVKYWREDWETLFSRSQVYIIGNPIVSWTCLVGVLAFLGTAVFALRYREAVWVKSKPFLPAARCVARAWAPKV